MSAHNDLLFQRLVVLGTGFRAVLLFATHRGGYTRRLRQSKTVIRLTKKAQQSSIFVGNLFQICLLDNVGFIVEISLGGKTRPDCRLRLPSDAILDRSSQIPWLRYSSE